MSSPTNSTPPSAPLRDAATVILVRPARAAAGGTAPEIYFLRRHQKVAFMGGAYVFPGGKLDPADSDDAWQAHVPKQVRQQCAKRLEPTPGRGLDERTALGLHVAAIRELFEEAGVLLAQPRLAAGQGMVAGQRRAAVPTADPARAERLAAWRRDLNLGTKTFAEMLEAEQLVPDIAALSYWAHWITPSFESRRFDARFFIAVLPDGACASLDQQETCDELWLSAEQALARAQQSSATDQSFVLPPPTLRTVQELAAFGSIADLMRAASERTVAPILPKVHLLASGEASILLPWDPDYSAAEGEDLPGLAWTGHPLAADAPSRVVLRDGRWVALRP